jgi:hypothetical protein
VVVAEEAALRGALVLARDFDYEVSLGIGLTGSDGIVAGRLEDGQHADTMVKDRTVVKASWEASRTA